MTWLVETLLEARDRTLANLTRAQKVIWLVQTVLAARVRWDLWRRRNGLVLPKIALPGRGLSSPIVVGDKVVVTCNSGFQQDRLHVLCFDAARGTKLWERQREAVQLILKAWTEPEPFGWEGKHFQYRQVSIWPKPVQKPHPPLVISASNADSAKFAAEMRATMGMVLLADLPSGKECIRIYKETAKASGWEPTAENVLVGMHTCIAETDEEARRSMAHGLKYFDQVLMGGLQASQRIVLQKTRYFENEESRDRWKSRLDKRRTLTLDEAIERGTVLCGSPETVVKQIKRIHSELGHGVFNFTVKVGTLPDEVIRRGMELFRDRVHPHVRDL